MSWCIYFVAVEYSRTNVRNWQTNNKFCAGYNADFIRYNWTLNKGSNADNGNCGDCHRLWQLKLMFSIMTSLVCLQSSSFSFIFFCLFQKFIDFSTNLLQLHQYVPIRRILNRYCVNYFMALGQMAQYWINWYS